MYNSSDAKTNYCSYLKRNVLLVRGEAADVGKPSWDCMNKSECNYFECGCRNSLIGNINNFECALFVPHQSNVEN